MTRTLPFALVLALAAATARAADPEPIPSPPAPARISLSFAQGFAFLDGGYADAAFYYSDYWETGQSWSLRADMDFLPVLRAGLTAAVLEHGDRGFGIDTLHRGHLRLAASLRLPTALRSDFLTESDALDAVRGPVLFLRLEAGLAVVDPTHHALGGLYDRTYTWSVAARLGIEYRLDEIGFFLEFGADLQGPPRASASFRAHPDPILAFPVGLGLSLYLP